MIGLILLAGLGLLLIPLFLIKPKIGLLAYVATFPFTNLALLPGIGIDKVVGFMALASWLIYSLHTRKLKVLPTKQFIALLLFVSLAILSIWFISISPNKLNLTLFYLSLPILFLMLVNLVDSEKFLRQLILVLVLSMGIYLLLSITGYLMGIEAVIKKGRLGGIVSNAPNILGYYTVGILPLSLLIARSRDLGLRWLGWIVSIAGTAAVILTYDRGAFLSLALMALLILVTAKGRRIRMLSLTALGLVILILIAPPAWMSRVSTIASPDILTTTRGFLALVSIRMVLDRPLFGVGIDGFRYNLPRYLPLTLIAEGNPWLYQRIRQVGVGRYLGQPHGVYTATLSETGFVGFGLFSFIIICSLVSLKRLKRLTWSHDSRNIVRYIMIGLLTFLFVSAFYASGRDQILWFYLFLPTVIHRLAVRSKAMVRKQGA